MKPLPCLSVPPVLPRHFCHTSLPAPLKSITSPTHSSNSGKTLTVQASGNVTSTIRRGAHALLSVKLRLNYGGQIPILQRDEDLCDLLERDRDINEKCPIEKDETVSFTKKVDIPGRVPKGKFQVLVDALTEKQEKITCLTTEIEF